MATGQSAIKGLAAAALAYQGIETPAPALVEELV